MGPLPIFIPNGNEYDYESTKFKVPIYYYSSRTNKLSTYPPEETQPLQSLR